MHLRRIAGRAAAQICCRDPPGAFWAPAAKGFKYSDPTAAAAGIKTVLLKSGDAGKSKIIVKGKGGALDMPPLPLAQDQHVIVQLKNTFEAGRCWEARYSSPAKKNDAKVFKDKGDAPVATPTASVTASVTATTTATATLTPTPLGPTATATSTGAATQSATVTATATRTDTATPSTTPTPTATPTMSSSVCGNGFLEAGETCANCPADCTVLACTATAPI